jgi:hypothetical protein
MFPRGAVTASARWQNRWLDSPFPDMAPMFLNILYVYSMSVIVITVRHSTSLPSPSKPAPEIFGGGQSICEVPAEVRLVKQHTLGGGGPLTVYLWFDPAKGYRLLALVAQAVTPQLGTRPYDVTTVVRSGVTHHLAPLPFGGTTAVATGHRKELLQSPSVG